MTLSPWKESSCLSLRSVRSRPYEGAIHTFRGQGTFRAFLFGIGRIQLYVHYRKRVLVAEAQVLLGDEDEPAVLADPLEVVREALLQPPQILRTVTELFYYEKLSRDGIARQIGAPAGTVASRLRRARRALEKRLRGALESGERTALLG
jgi:DNA-directed RNA polymerase specialized sigma24 family protein